MKEFDLDFQKETSVKQAKITKAHQKKCRFQSKFNDKEAFNFTRHSLNTEM